MTCATHFFSRLQWYSGLLGCEGWIHDDARQLREAAQESAHGQPEVREAGHVEPPRRIAQLGPPLAARLHVRAGNEGVPHPSDAKMQNSGQTSCETLSRTQRQLCVPRLLP